MKYKDVFESVPAGKKKKNIEDRQKKMEYIANTPITMMDYVWCDTGLNEPTGFNDTFKPFFENEDQESLEKFLIRELQIEHHKKIVGIEMGGIGQQLFYDLRNIIAKSAGISLRDSSEDIGFNQFEYPDIIYKNNHNIIVGDIMDLYIYPKILEKLQVDKVDFIIERLGDGVITIPQNPFKIVQIIIQWYKMLNSPGVILAQLPFNPNEKKTLLIWRELIDKWAKKYSSDKLEITTKYNDNLGMHIFKLIKNPGAPDQLSFLPTQDVLKIISDYSK